MMSAVQIGTENDIVLCSMRLTTNYSEKLMNFNKYKR